MVQASSFLPRPPITKLMLNSIYRTLLYLDLGLALSRILKRTNMKKKIKLQSVPKDLRNALMTVSKIRILKERCRCWEENKAPRQNQMSRSHKVNK